jgi:hypothetical protein
MKCSKSFVFEKTLKLFFNLTLFYALSGPSFFVNSFAFARSSDSLQKDLEHLYPELSKKALQLKIENAVTPFLFLRSFVPYSFDRIKDLELKLFKQLKSQTGWCIGDAHIENFGTLLDRNGNSFFSINDMDDAGPCPLVADALRFFTSVLLQESSTELDPLLKAYFKGLSHDVREEISFRKPIRKLLEKAEEKGFELKKKDVNKAETTLDREDDTIEIDSLTEQKLSVALKNAYGQTAQLIDALEKKREAGGSGGLKRFVTLVKQKGQSPSIRVIEFKQLVNPGIFPLAQVIPPAPERVSKTLLLQQGRQHSLLYQVQKIGDLWMLLRPRWKGHIGIKIEDFDEDELDKILKDEAFYLGHLHKKSADTPGLYVEKVLKTEPQLWIQSVRLLAKEMKRSFEELNQ